MTRVKTSCRVRIYEVSDEAVPGVMPELCVETHWNHDDRVVLVTPQGERFTIIASDLHLAINRCSR